MKPYQLRNTIIGEIRSGERRPGEYLGSARELSERHAVPLITVNRVMAQLAEHGYVNRIKGRGSFVADSARTRGEKPSFHFGLAFLGDFRTNTPAAFSAFGILPCRAEELLREQGHSFSEFTFLDLHNPDFDREQELDGLLVSASLLDHETMPVLLARNYPIVIVQQTRAYSAPFHQVWPDLSGGFFQAAQLFRKKGVAAIELLLAAEETSQQRCELFEEAAQWAGFRPEELHRNLAQSLRGDFGQLSGYRLGSELLRDFRKGTAYFVPSDFLAFGVLSAFLEQDLEPGVDFHLISFDNLEEESLLPFGAPILTSVDFPKRAVISSAIELLEQECSCRSASLRHQLLPARLIVRKSCTDLE